MVKVGFGSQTGKTETENATGSVNWKPADRNRLTEKRNSWLSDKMKADAGVVVEEKVINENVDL